MSDSPEGEGWWMASDNRWYPPETQERTPGSRADDRPVDGDGSGSGTWSPQLLTGILVALAFIAGTVTGWAVWRGDDSSAAGPSAASAVEDPASTPSPTARTDQPVDPSVDATAPGFVTAEVGGTVELFPGATVTIGPGDIDGDGRFSAVPAALPAPVGPVFAPVGPVFNLEVEGAALVGPVVVEVELDDVALSPPDSPEQPPVLFVLHWTGNEWEPIAVDYDPATRVAAFETSSFSIFGFFSLAWDVVKDAAEQFLVGLTGGLLRSVEDPECSGTADAWGVRATTGPMLWCSEDAADGGHRLRLVNKERYAVLVSWSEGATDTESSQGSLAAQLSDFLAPGASTVVGPGGSITIEVSSTVESAQVRVEYDGLAQALTAVVVSAEILAYVNGKIPFSKSATVEQIIEKLDLIGCLTGAGLDPGEIIAEPFQSVTELISACFGTDALKEMFGSFVGNLLGGIVALLGSTATFFLGSGAAFFDILTGEADQTFTVTKGDESDVPVTTEDLIDEFAGWPTNDKEGSIPFFTYLGASFIVPSWTSCSENYCIAGSGDTVYAFDLRDGIADFGSIPIDYPDPIGAFLDAGLSEQEIADLFAPG